MQELDNEFFEAYKRLERLCSGIYDCRNGVSQYIADMECTPYQDRLAVPSWEQSYKTLKHLRWVRNQIAHDSGQIQICEECDIHDTNGFYDDIMLGRDPITQLRRYYDDRAAVKKAARRAESTTMSTVSSCSDADQPAYRRAGQFAAAILLIAGVVAIILRLLADLP